MSDRRFFSPRLYAYLRDLAANNERDWFKANQDRFEEVVRQPALDFIEAFAGPLYEISPHFTADPRKVGGSLFRIQRDIRFSKDKTPYKTHVGIHFRHVATREDVHAPGFYLHLEPAGSFAALGMWRPSTANAYAIRDRIAEDPAAWERAAYGTRFRDMYGDLEGDSLVRPPRGHDPDHPLIDDLKRKDFIASTRLSQAAVTDPGFLRTYAETVKVGTPFMRYLCDALGLGF